MNQRTYMRQLYKQYGNNESVLVTEYAKAEKNNIVPRKKNTYKISAEQYAKALYQDGIRKGWIKE